MDAQPVPPRPDPTPYSAPPPPAPVTPGPAADPPMSPTEWCRKQNPLMREFCIDIECSKSRFSAHAECVKRRADQESMRPRAGPN